MNCVRCEGAADKVSSVTGAGWCTKCVESLDSKWADYAPLVERVRQILPVDCYRALRLVVGEA